MLKIIIMIMNNINIEELIDLLREKANKHLKESDSSKDQLKIMQSFGKFLGINEAIIELIKIKYTSNELH